MSTDPTTITDEKIAEILNRYHEAARANGTLEAVAAEITSGPGGREEILYEIEEHDPELSLAELSGDDVNRLRRAVFNYGERLAAELVAAALEPGDRVRIKADPSSRLGALLLPTDVGFTGTVAGGTEGTFRGKHPNELLEGWILVDVEAAAVELGGNPPWTMAELGDPETFVVPVRSSSIERIQ